MTYPQRRESKQLQDTRRYAHRIFDKTWTTHYQRTLAYLWLAEQMKLSVKECHISQFSFEQCQEVIRLVRKLQPVFEDRNPSEKRFERKRKEIYGV